MTSGPGWPTGEDADDTLRDVVGARVLTGVQMIDVSRLSAHPVPMVNSGLVTVAGQGPKDSNGAGKSSFIAALSLLSADEQWRLAGGGVAAAELLFTAEVAAQDGRWSNVDRAYVIGVFTDPLADTAQALSASALTVWLRINRKAPYLDLRWREGRYVPAAGSDAQRVALVDGMWEDLAKRNGRHDIHANRLADTLYGPHVRCVSFLSTSVRASPTANLLAQPLNELTPARIFDAIATLTGLDRELEQEQGLRSAEHGHRVKVHEAQRDLSRWEEEMAVVESGISRRAAAREQLDHTRHLWHSHCAKRVVEGHDWVEEIRRETQRLTAEWESGQTKLAKLSKERADLRDDEAFKKQCTEAEKLWKELDAKERQLDFDYKQNNKQIEELSQRRIGLLEQARDADGRDRDTAAAEELIAVGEETAAIEKVGAAKKAVEDAQDNLADAEGGEDLAAAQLRQLRVERITAAALLDAVTLTEDQRAVWEPRLVPYHHAVVVPAAQAQPAAAYLAGLPGSMLVLADPPDETSGHTANGTLPVSVDTRFSLHRFLSALATRAEGDTGGIDAQAGVLVVGGFSKPTTGRATRIAQARDRLTAASGELEKMRGHATLATGRLRIARRRHQAAIAAEEAESLKTRIAGLRTDNERIAGRQEELKPVLARATAMHVQLLAAQTTRQDQIARLAAQITTLDNAQSANVNERTAFGEEQVAIDLDTRLRQWGATVDDARRHILALDEEPRAWTAEDWAREACHQLDTVLRGCFPYGTDEEIPAEIRELTRDGRWAKGSVQHRRELFPALRQALRTHLAQTEEHDTYQHEQITAQRRGRTGDLAAAQTGLREASLATAAHRGSLSQGIKSRLKQVAAEFDRLDLDYGGYGAGLDYPEPEPPAEPDKPWRWTITPKWRRAEGQRPSPYNLRGNTAQMDEKAVKLVCAAALAGGNDRPLLLILDELGRNLGKQHRREAVALFEQIGRARNITVIGALQDDMERYAIDASGLYIKLRRGSDAQAYNDAPVVVGHDANTDRVEMLRDWLNAGRPPATGSSPRQDDE